MKHGRYLLIAGAVASLAIISAGMAQQHGGPDTRELVKMPPMMASHMLANMRDHLMAISEIQAAMGAGKHNDAAKIAEERLGMSSHGAHGSSHMAGFMPQGMRDAGDGMHRAASRFAIAVKDAEVLGDLKPAITALSEVTQACAGCHAGYRTH